MRSRRWTCGGAAADEARKDHGEQTEWYLHALAFEPFGGKWQAETSLPTIAFYDAICWASEAARNGRKRLCTTTHHVTKEQKTHTLT